MTAQAVWLFGSQARGDSVPGSDVDLLLVTSERRTRHVAMGTVSFYLYPWRQLIASAEQGDLFTCHLSREAKTLHDPGKRLDRLRDCFRFKTSYAAEVRSASDLAWFIVYNSRSIAPAVAAKRAAWCVRTILIARSAEQRTPVFAASDLATFSGSATVSRLIAYKDRPDCAERSAKLLRPFLEEFGMSDPVPQGDIEAFENLFKRTHNRVAFQTLRAERSDENYS